MTMLNAALDAFLTDCAARNLSAKTLSYYRQQLGKLIGWLVGREIATLDAVTAGDLRRYLVHLAGSGLRPASVLAGARALRAWLNWCEREELVTVSPARKLALPKRANTLRPALSLADCWALLDAAEGSYDPLRDRAIVLTLLDTGLRASELCALRVGDLAGNRLRVQHGKGDRARTVFVGPVALGAITEYLSTRPGVADGDALFASHETGRALTYIGLHEVVQRLAKRAGVVAACHGLRRTFAVESLRAGCDLVRLAKLMGHSDLTMLQRHYLPLVDNDLAAAHAATSPGDRLGGRGAI